MANNRINEELEKFNRLTGYNPEKGLIKEVKVRKSYLAEAEPEDEEAPEEVADEGGDFDFGDEGSPEEVDVEVTDEETPEVEEDEFGTAGGFTASDDLESEDDEVEEIDVTSIVTKSEEAKDLAQQAVNVGQENTEFLKSLTDKLSNLESSLTKMDTIASKINKLEQNIKTPEEKLELRSLDSYPFNVNLSDYWEEKASTDKNYRISGGKTSSDGETKEYVITPDMIDDYNESDIQNSFNPTND